MTSEWRDWRLIHYTTEKRPPETPPKQAEVSSDGAWAQLLADDGRTVIAAWMRYRMPTRETLQRAAEARRAIEARRPPTRKVS
jgi:hypothetical protein